MFFNVHLCTLFINELSKPGVSTDWHPLVSVLPVVNSSSTPRAWGRRLPQSFACGLWSSLAWGEPEEKCLLGKICDQNSGQQSKCRNAGIYLGVATSSKEALRKRDKKHFFISSFWTSVCCVWVVDPKSVQLQVPAKTASLKCWLISPASSFQKVLLLEFSVSAIRLLSGSAGMLGAFLKAAPSGLKHILRQKAGLTLIAQCYWFLLNKFLPFTNVSLSSLPHPWFLGQISGQAWPGSWLLAH